MNTPDTEVQIEQIVNKVRYVEFLHGVPVELPSRTKELLRSGIREALTSRDTYCKERLDAERAEDIEIIEGECDWYNTNNQIPDSELPKGDAHWEMLTKIVKDSLMEVKNRVIEKIKNK